MGLTSHFRLPGGTPFLRVVAAALSFGAALAGWAQVTVTTDFRGNSADGWVFGGSAGSTTPFLTAAQGLDPVGDGWLRLTQNLTNQSTYALFDNAIFSVNAQIQIEMEYAFYNGTGADGIAFFLIDGSVDAGSFSAGAFGGSMGYAQKTGIPGMTGGYLGFAFDNFGNYSNPTEGRVGGTGFVPNAIAVRASAADDYAFVAGSGPLQNLPGGGQMDFPDSTARPDQGGADYRAFRLTLDANNLLTVEMKFGADADYLTAFTADLSAYDRPETFKLGFTGATGSATEIHEIRNLRVEMTPWQPTANEWDNGAGNTDAGNALNWHGDVLPGVNADILFGNRPSSGPQTVSLPAFNAQINSLTFDSSYNYTLSGAGSITLGDPVLQGLPSINVNNYNGAQAQHKINVPLTLAEQLRINNYSFSVLCLNGTITTGGNDLTVNGWGAVNFNADLIGSGNIIKNGGGVLAFNNNNADGAPWTGHLTLNGGLTVVTANGALGSTAGTTTVNDGATLALRGGVNYTYAESVTIKGSGFYRGGEGLTGALYNDGGNNTFAGNVTLGTHAAIGSRDGNLTLTGKVSDGVGTFSLTKVGSGVVTLTNSTNDWNGATIIRDGVLRIAGNQNALAGGFTTNGYSGGNLQLAGGVLEIGLNTTFSRQLGTGSDQVQWTGDGGFSASGANRTVSLTNSSGTANGQLTWNAGSFVPTGNALVLSSAYADANVTLTNAINLGNALREVRVHDGSAAVDGTLSGSLTGSGGGLIKTGDGTLNLTGSNTYTGATEIRGGALRGNISSNSNLVLNGGVRELTANLSATLGTGAGQLRWTGDGGFSASGANRSVTLNGGAALTWGSTANFVGANRSLILGSNSASHTVTLTNAINLGGANRTVRMQDGAAAIDGLLSGVLSNGSLTVVGQGTLASTAANTLGGTLTVSGAQLRLQGGGTATSVTGIAVNQGGAFTLDNSGTNNLNRIGNSTDVSLQGGTFNFLGAAATSSETIGALNLGGGANTVTVQRSGSNSSVLTASSLARNAGATVDFTPGTGGGTLGTTGANPRMIFTSAPTLISNVLGYATVNGTAFAGYNATNGIVAVAGTNTAQSSWTSAINATPGADQTLTASRTVGSLSLGSGIDVALGSNTLTIASGGLLATGATTSLITGGTLRTGTGMADLITHVYGSGGLNISSVIADNSGARGLTKTGDGTLTLSGSAANTFTGVTRVNDGTLVLAKSAGVNALAGHVIVGDGRGTDVLEISASEQIANHANVTLVGGNYGGGETILRLNGSSGGITETFGNLTVSGAAVIDFAGGNPCAPNFLYLDSLSMLADSTLYLRNWIEFTDFLLVRVTDLPTLPGLLSQIHFEGYGAGAYWQAYDEAYVRITPVPEPSTYGALLIGMVTTWLAWRRRRRLQAGSLR